MTRFIRTWTTIRQTLNCGSSVFPRNGDIQVDLAFPVFEQGDGEADGELCGLRAFHFVTQGELVEEDLIFGRQILVFNLVFQVEGEFPLLDIVSDMASRVRRYGAQFHISE